MIQRNESGETITLTNHGFILDVELDARCAFTIDEIGMKIADSLTWVEGCGKVSVGYLGEMEPEQENE